MYKNYLKIAFRSLQRHKLFTLLNVLGLGFGIACFLMIGMYTIDELTFDNFHENRNEIYRVIQHQQSPEIGDQSFGAVSYNVARAAREEVAGVDNSVKLFMWGRAAIRIPDSKEGFYHPFLTTENSIFSIFNFPLSQGDPATALANPNTVVLSKELSVKLFGSEDALGQSLRSDRGMDLLVTGVLEEIPVNSHLQFDVLISQATLEAQPQFNEMVQSDWGSQNWGTYLELHPEADPVKIGNQLTALAETRANEDRPFRGQLELQPLSDIHFGSANIQREMNEAKGSYSYLYIFSLIGFFIIGIACINYINLSTARASTYSREVGVRKVVGANLRQLLGRFMSESIILTFGAFIIALVLVQVALPWFNDFTNKSLSLYPSNSSWTIPLSLGIIFLVSIIAGSYPSIFLSRFKPQEVLKGSFSHGKMSRGWLRKGLVISQFSLSIIMIIGTLVAWEQINFIKKKDLGFDKESLLVVDINSGIVRNGFETIRNRYGQIPDVKSVSVSSRVPGEWKNLLQAEVRISGNLEEKGKIPWFIGADEQFLETFGIELISGRNFDQDRLSDSSAVILNSQAANMLNITEASGQEIQILSRINNGSERRLPEPYKAKVIGITKDYNFQSLYEPIGPLMLGHRNNPIQSIDYFTARISGQNIERTIAQMTDILHSVDPNQLFEYHFLDEQIAQFYEADIQQSSMFTIAALCAIFIACLGLFGLATFTAERRTKEIGIRKVLGASSRGIVGLLSKDFLKLVIIALVIASPIAWYFLNGWLQDFAYHISVGWKFFLQAGILTIVIAFVTVSFQSIKTALSNPIESLRTE